MKKDIEISKEHELFCEAYINTRDICKAVRLAGLKTTRPGKYGRDLLYRPEVALYLKKRWAELKDVIVIDQTEVLMFLSDTIRDNKTATKDRLKAAELMCKIYKLFDDNKMNDRPQIIINTPLPLPPIKRDTKEANNE